MRTLCVALFALTPLLAQADDGITSSKPSALEIGALKFRGIGPALASGRIADLAVDSVDSSRWFIAVASGGVWRTENHGITFEPVFDSQSSYSIGCVTIDPNNRHTIWVGSGENNSQRSVSWGDGVYRSLDGGRTWKNMGLRNSEHIGKIVVDPRDSRVVWVAAQGPLWKSGGDRGLYKTTDGGETWNKVLDISEHTGVNEVVLDPRNPDIAIASSYQRRRHVWTLINGGPESGIHKTTDGGKTWRKITTGLPAVDKGRIGLAMASTNPDVVYAIIEAQRGKGGTFRSVDGGESWTKQSGKVSNSPQYYNELVCDPHDVDTVYCLDTWTSVSRDGGKTWSPVGNKHRHVDDHALWIDPRNPRHLLIGGDGGIYETYDGGKNWDFRENLPVTQFYRVSADQALPFYNIYGGTQDNNSMGGPSRTTSLAGITNEDWFVTVGGDGYEAQVDPTNPDIVYTQWQYGGLVRHDRKSGELTDIKPRQAPDEPPIVWNWDSPLMISSHSHTRLYFAGDRLFRSDDRGDSWRTISGDLTRGIDRDQLKVMGRVQDVDAVAKNASTSVYGNCVSLAESPVDENVLFVGTDDGLIHVTSDGGQSWRKIASVPGVPEQTYVSRLEASRHSADRIYAGFSNHKNGDFKPYVFVSDDRGATWQSIAANLPATDVVWSVAEDHVNENLLFVGTEYGLWVSLNRGESWIRMKSGLPTVAVRDIEIQRRENDLILGTFGRGFYVLDDYTPLRSITEDAMAAPAQLFGVRKAPLYIQRSRLGLNTGLGSQGSTFYAAPNPEFGAIITYRLRDGLQTQKERRETAQADARKSDESYPFPTDEQMRAEARENEPAVFVTIRDASGAFVRRVDAPRTAGMHRIAWDLRYPKATKVELSSGGPGAPWSMPAAGPLVLPGKFSATLEQEVAGVVSQLAGPVEFEVEALGLATLPAADRAEVLTFQKDVVELRRAVRATSRVLGELQTRIDHIRVAARRGNVDPAMLARIEELDGNLADLRVALSGDRSLSGRNKPAAMSISNRIENVAGSQLYTSSAPTQTERDAYRFAAQAFEPVLAQVRSLATVDLPALERALELAGVGDTPGRLPEWRKR
ncbi:MAG: glycosyl hydrolase [bacterium]|nr:glycosyl hydrolase [bacterium]